MRQTPTQLLVFTDLDNTLLDHNSYDCAPALPVLQRLREVGIPVIPATSKTLAEMKRHQNRLPLEGPCIAENGSLIQIPAGPLAATASRRILGVARETILAELAVLRLQGYLFQGFHDIGVKEVVALTGLDRESAALAMDRQASEPLLWEGTPAALEDFTAALEERGLRVIRGGRFLHVMGPCDKADALHFLRERYRPCWPEKNLVTIALGDSPNDRAMLGAADIAVIMGTPENAGVHAKGQQSTLYAGGAGPVFWAQAVSRLLDHYAL